MMNFIMTITSNNNNNNNNSHTPTNNIIFECSDIKNDIGLMITKNNNNTNNENNNFQLHLYDGYNDISLVIRMNLKDFANMFDALGHISKKKVWNCNDGPKKKSGESTIN